MRAPLLLLLSLACTCSLGCGDNVTPPARKPATGGDAGALACAPDLDGKIESRELQPAIGVPASYLVSPAGVERTVDLVGKSEGGRRVWTFGVDYADDQALTVTATALAGKWYAASFPTGEFVTPFDVGGTTEAVYRKDDRALFLLGLASSVEAPKEGKTLLVYGEPIPVFRFPIVAGDKYVAAGTVTGATVRGLPYAGKDIYEVEVDTIGKLVLYDFTFEQVHRVRTKVTVSPAVGAATSRRQVSFLAECFGEVMRATSRAEEPNPDFSVAAELRRLGQ